MHKVLQPLKGQPKSPSLLSKTFLPLQSLSFQKQKEHLPDPQVLEKLVPELWMEVLQLVAMQ